MIKVIVTGPESSGKTTLCQSLAEHYRVPWLPEYARTYLEQLDRAYQEEDLLRIAEEQVAQEDQLAQQKPPLLVCDTSLLVIKIWGNYRYGRCHPWIEQQLAQRPVDYYLLCRPDIPWQPDPQRENPDDRDELFVLYQNAFRAKPHTIIAGDKSARLKTAVATIDRLLAS